MQFHKSTVIVHRHLKQQVLMSSSYYKLLTTNIFTRSEILGPVETLSIS